MSATAPGPAPPERRASVVPPTTCPEHLLDRHKDDAAFVVVGRARPTQGMRAEPLGRGAALELHEMAGAEGAVELVVEPLHDRAADVTAHMTVTPAGDVVWHGVRQTHNDGHSSRGSDRVEEDLRRTLNLLRYRDTMEDVASKVAREGCHGPLFVDSMMTRQGLLLPVVEGNARLSPGVIAQLIDAPLRLRMVGLSGGDAYERLVTALADRKCLAVDGCPGLLPLAAAPLVPPRGWLFFAGLGGADLSRDGLGGVLDEVLRDLEPQLTGESSSHGR